MKKNAEYSVVKRKDVKNFKNISSEQTIKLKGFYSKKKIPYHLRRFRPKDSETGKYIVLLNNNFSWLASTIAKINKERWQIEIFFLKPLNSN